METYRVERYMVETKGGERVKTYGGDIQDGDIQGGDIGWRHKVET